MDPDENDDGIGASPDELRAELARLTAERDAANAELERLRDLPEQRHRLRRVASTTLVVISVLALLAGSVGVWASRSLLDTDVWVERVGPLADDPDVQATLSAELTDQIMALVDPEALFEEVLPERGQLLAVPLSGAVENFVGDLSAEFVASDAFERLWIAANRVAHDEAVKVLRGDAEAVQANDGNVTLNLVPVINQVLASITSQSPELFGRTIAIPDVQIDEVPSSAIAKINDAFGTDLPDDFGQVTVYDQGQLKELQDAVKLFDRIVWVSVVLFLLSTVGALALSVDRRRTFLHLAIAYVVVLVLVRRAAIAAQNQLIDLVRADDNVPAVEAATDALTSGLFDATRLLIWLLIAAIAVAWIAGRSRSATGTRHWVAAVASNAADATRARREDPATATWLVEHRDLLRILGVVAALVALLVIDLSWFGLLIVLIVFGGFELLVTRAGTPSGSDENDPEETTTGS